MTNTFVLTFYKELNAFEIYKLDQNGNADLNSDTYDQVSKEWKFVWRDKLRIQWDGGLVPGGHWLRFSKPNGEVSSRGAPVSGHESTSNIDVPLIYSGEEITLTRGVHGEAHWEFDFRWGPTGVIDPKAKIKDTPN